MMRTIKKQRVPIDELELEAYQELVGHLVAFDSDNLIVIECSRRHWIRLSPDDAKSFRRKRLRVGQNIAILKLEDGRLLARPAYAD